jgi:hypothetical protein
MPLFFNRSAYKIAPYNADRPAININQKLSLLVPPNVREEIGGYPCSTAITGKGCKSGEVNAYKCFGMTKYYLHGLMQ